jgi:hypothetical protein
MEALRVDMEPIYSEADIPDFANEEEEDKFWSTHCATPEFLRSTPRPTGTLFQRARERLSEAAKVAEHTDR